QVARATRCGRSDLRSSTGGAAARVTRPPRAVEQGLRDDDRGDLRDTSRACWCGAIHMPTCCGRWPSGAPSRAGRTALVLGSPVCPPFLGVDVQYRLRPPCSEVSQSIARWLEAPQPASVTGVVLAARWSLYDGE